MFAVHENLKELETIPLNSDRFSVVDLKFPTLYPLFYGLVKRFIARIAIKKMLSRGFNIRSLFRGDQNIYINANKSTSMNTNQIPLSGNRLKLRPWSPPTCIESASLSIGKGRTSILYSFYCISNHNLDNGLKFSLKLHAYWCSYWRNKLSLTNRKKLSSAEKYGCK